MVVVGGRIPALLIVTRWRKIQCKPQGVIIQGFPIETVLGSLSFRHTVNSCRKFAKGEQLFEIHSAANTQ